MVGLFKCCAKNLKTRNKDIEGVENADTINTPLLGINQSTINETSMEFKNEIKQIFKVSDFKF